MKTPTKTKKRARYAYVPFNRGADIESDCMQLDMSGQAGWPAGQVICTVDGSEPSEPNSKTLDGLYAQRVTRKSCDSAFGRAYVSQVLANAIADAEDAAAAGEPCWLCVETADQHGEDPLPATTSRVCTNNSEPERPHALCEQCAGIVDDNLRDAAIDAAETAALFS